jgi:hypothetical protein
VERLEFGGGEGIKKRVSFLCILIGIHRWMVVPLMELGNFGGRGG